MSGARGLPIGPERAQALAARSAERRRRLTLPDVEAQLGELATPEDARRWARQAYLWAAAGVIPGSAANGCASLVREWRQLWELQIDVAAIGRLEKRVKQLEAELAAARAGRPAP